MAPKKASFIAPKPQTFAILVGQSLSISTSSRKPFNEQSEFFHLRVQLSDEVEPFELETCSPISLR